MKLSCLWKDLVYGLLLSVGYPIFRVTLYLKMYNKYRLRNIKIETVMNIRVRKLITIRVLGFK